MPNTGAALVDADGSGDAVFHTGKEGFANDGDHGLVVKVAIVLFENPLLFTENVTADLEEAFDVLLGSRDLEDEIVRTVGGESL